MAKKFGDNSKKVQGRERKATVRAEKEREQVKQREQEEARKWEQGAKDTSRQDREEEKKLRKRLEKEERKEELRREEAALASGKPRYAASNIDDAILLLGRRDQVQLDQHPERRMKAAYAAFEDTELPRLKQENPGLRHSQLKEILWDRWKKSEMNPFNQPHVAYNVKRDERERAAAAVHEKQTAHMRDPVQR